MSYNGVYIIPNWDDVFPVKVESLNTQSQTYPSNQIIKRNNKVNNKINKHIKINPSINQTFDTPMEMFLCGRDEEEIIRKGFKGQMDANY